MNKKVKDSFFVSGFPENIQYPFEYIGVYFDYKSDKMGRYYEWRFWQLYDEFGNMSSHLGGMWMGDLQDEV